MESQRNGRERQFVSHSKAAAGTSLKLRQRYRLGWNWLAGILICIEQKGCHDGDEHEGLYCCYQCIQHVQGKDTFSQVGHDNGCTKVGKTFLQSGCGNKTNAEQNHPNMKVAECIPIADPTFIRRTFQMIPECSRSRLECVFLCINATSFMHTSRGISMGSMVPREQHS